MGLRSPPCLSFFDELDITLVPLVDARLQQVEDFKVLVDLLLGLLQQQLVCFLPGLRVSRQLRKNQMRMAEKKQIGGFFVAFAYVYLGLRNKSVLSSRLVEAMLPTSCSIAWADRSQYRSGIWASYS
jgi:hypothetical protein